MFEDAAHTHSCQDTFYVQHIKIIPTISITQQIGDLALHAIIIHRFPIRM